MDERTLEDGLTWLWDAATWLSADPDRLVIVVLVFMAVSSVLWSLRRRTSKCGALTRKLKACRQDAPVKANRCAAKHSARWREHLRRNAVFFAALVAVVWVIHPVDLIAEWVSAQLG